MEGECFMKFKMKQHVAKEESVYKTIYIRKTVLEQVLKIAREHDTSFNNVVVSMIESCLEEEE